MGDEDWTTISGKIKGEGILNNALQVVQAVSYFLPAHAGASYDTAAEPIVMPRQATFDRIILFTARQHEAAVAISHL
jgi:hypothetical protein